MKTNILAIAGLTMSLTLLPLAGEARDLKLEDYFDLERVGAPQISPNGKTIIFNRSRVDAKKDRFDGELWVMDADGSRQRRLLADGGGAVWSPDGTRIAYLDGGEVFVRWMDAEGATTQVTHEGAKPFNLSWSPDGKWLAYMAKVPTTTDWTINLPPRPEGAEWSGEARVVERLHYRLDGAGLVDGEFNHIFVVPAEGGTPKQLTTGQWHAMPLTVGLPYPTGSLEWTPDSQSIIFSADPRTDYDTRWLTANLHAVNIANGNLRQITKGDGFWGSSVGTRISPNGKQIAYIGQSDSTTSNYPNQELRVIGLDGSDDRVLIADLPGRVSFMKWADNGKSLYYIVSKQGSHHLHNVSLSGQVKQITEGARSFGIASVSDKGVAVGTLTDAYNPAEVVSFNLANGRNLQTLTAVNKEVLGDIQLGKVEEIWYDSTDNTRVQGWVVYPPNFDASKRYPLILYIHGGPEGMYNGNFNFTYQDMAAQGYVVLYTNPRGSTGYGGAFTQAIYDAYPGRFDYDDLMHGVDTVVGRGFVDTERLYIQGCSGGGTLTAWVVANTDRFAGAAALCPIVNMISFAGSSDVNGWAFNRYKKPFWEDPTAWLESSSIMRINKVKTPTLVMVGEHDIRTPVPQSEELYTALKILDVPTKLILFKDEWHGTSSKPSNMYRTQLYLRKWYDQWRRVEEGGKAYWRENK